jgi:hypothetical protein
MQRFASVAALAILGTLLCPSRGSAAEQPVIVIRRPTIVAFFAPVPRAKLKKHSDTDEALADFQFYAANARNTLQDAGIDFREVYVSSFRVQRGGRTTTFRPGKIKLGYYFVSLDKEPHVEYGVMTDTDLFQVAKDYFAVTAAPPATTSDYCLQAEQVSSNLELREDTTIHGRVTDEQGQPFRKSPIELRSFVSQAEQITLKRLSTDDDGNFDLGIVKRGNYRLLLSAHRGFQQPAKLECRQKNCALDTMLIVNPTDLPAAGCPIR